ncbi:MAG: sulfite exporter TauE/SafE family protein [Candidatus Nanoarchaeia archaeon]|nr:sulfite exporter TauE/SafE family protein [Candidatus Nanoarchaeia archaeon]MDD5239469.1 sulfite exporter TauE/SafE family protein [Candidatus Nanoarchaeia archaeon]
MDLILGAAIFFIGFIQAAIGSTVSGGGIIAIPALMALGVPPLMTLGTIRPAYLAGAFVSGWRFKVRGYLKLKEALTMIVPAFIGALIGASLILRVSETFTKYLIAAVVLVSIILLLVKKEAGVVKTKKKHSVILLVIIGFGTGIISGAVGIVGGTISMVALIILEGFTFKEAIALNNVRGLGNQTAALIVFALASFILWDYAIILMLGSIVGGIVGVEIAHKLPLKMLKPIFIVVAILLTIKFLFF